MFVSHWVRWSACRPIRYQVSCVWLLWIFMLACIELTIECRHKCGEFNQAFLHRWSRTVFLAFPEKAWQFLHHKFLLQLFKIHTTEDTISAPPIKWKPNKVKGCHKPSIVLTSGVRCISMKTYRHLSNTTGNFCDYKTNRSSVYVLTNYWLWMEMFIGIVPIKLS